MQGCNLVLYPVSAEHFGLLGRFEVRQVTQRLRACNLIEAARLAYIAKPHRAVFPVQRSSMAKTEHAR